MRLVKTSAAVLPLVALAGALVASLAVPSPASADPPEGRGYRGHGRARVEFRAEASYRPSYYRPVYRRPAYVRPAYRYVVYRPHRVLIVRPAPLVRIGARIGRVNVSAIFGSHARYDSYLYGCNFCDARFDSYDAYARHVRSCEDRPADVRVVLERWTPSNCDDPEWCADPGDGYDNGYDNGRYGDGN